jgi:hypothetical protein
LNFVEESKVTQPDAAEKTDKTTGDDRPESGDEPPAASDPAPEPPQA